MSGTNGEAIEPIYDALLAMMRARSLSQRETADELGVSRQLLHSWLVARNLPSEQYVPELARFLRMSPENVERSIRRARRVDRLATLERQYAELRAEYDELRAELAELRAGASRHSVSH